MPASRFLCGGRGLQCDAGGYRASGRFPRPGTPGRIAALQTRLTQAEARGASEVAQLQSQLVEARDTLVADLSARDQAYAEEISVFRREVTDIVSTPEGAAALARNNAGDRVGAIAVLDRLRQARDTARRIRADPRNIE